MLYFFKEELSIALDGRVIAAGRNDYVCLAAT